EQEPREEEAAPALADRAGRAGRDRAGARQRQR
ncbi:MAG: hypothetical protein AVDCRST_MAG67-798, partial [uncultured Solirubrobacteraceae bacterium]